MMQWSEEAFVGGHPALDFLNTVDNQDKQRSESRIGTWPAFFGWAAASGIFEGADRRRLEKLGARGGAAAPLAELHLLRETAYRVLCPLAAGLAPLPAHWALMEAELQMTLGGAILEPGAAGCRWRARPDRQNWVVDVLALTLEDLLRSPELARLRECGRCSWLFLDYGRGRGRRWCDMRTCGNRAKAESFRTR
ncbi:MAG: CGNR zinc finger domain-containing protein [Kiloniellaceae bacterium]